MARRTRPEDQPPEGGGGDLSQQEAEAELEQQNVQGAQARQDQLAEEIPPAAEALQPDRLNTLADTLNQAVQALSGGQIEDLPLQDVTEPQNAIPQDIWAALLATAAFAEAQGLTDFAIDLEDAAMTNQGLAEAAGTISEMAQSPEVLQATRSPTPQPPPTPETPPEEEKLDAARFV